MKPTVALVQGDAAGVGSELMTRLLDLEDVRERANHQGVQSRGFRGHVPAWREWLVGDDPACVSGQFKIGF